MTWNEGWRVKQGWEFALLLIRSLLFHSKSLIFKSNCEQFAHVALYKRETVSDLLPWLFKKERNWDSFFVKERITILLFRSQKRTIRLK